MRVKKKRILLFVVCFMVLGCIVLYFLTDDTITNKRLFDVHNEYAYFKGDFTSSKNISETSFTVSTFANKCPANAAGSSSNDIEMYNIYKQLKFDNAGGGVWTQGWNVISNVKRWTVRNKLKVFVVPHSHNDPGWRKTFEQYYNLQTRYIFNNMIEKLTEDKRRKFIWAEISYLSLWWAEANDDMKKTFKTLVDNGQIEIVTGGWVMTDEANSHYYSMIQQLTHGHQWLQRHLNLSAKHSWNIDTFGVSPTMPFILNHLGLESLVVQRTHYSIKKYLAKNKQLEFRWRQFWDNHGKYDLLTHMMPFYSYDIPHTCGPDPSVCCQFDFKRFSWFGLYCPWKVAPERITKMNVAFKADLLLDQYRKKAELYATNVLLVPLGDDFRYTSAGEWDSMFQNYQMLFDYINTNPSLHAEAKFGTLNDYFEALKKEKEPISFPSLSGDFFTYADRDDHYWSGYFTTRPFYKRMDRELMSYLRCAEIIHTMAWRSVPIEQSSWLVKSDNILNSLVKARESLSLFQHHDGITGTSKDFVVNDYAERLLSAIKGLQNVIQLSTQFLLTGNKDGFVPDEKSVYFLLNEDRKNANDQTTSQIYSVDEKGKKMVVFNSLTWNRKTILSIKIKDFRNILVVDADDNLIEFQITPLCSFTSYTDCYTLYFYVDIKPLELKLYYLRNTSAATAASSSNGYKLLQKMAKVNVYNSHDIKNQVNQWNMYISEKDIPSEFSVHNSQLSVAFNSNGLLKAITLKKIAVTIPVHMSFVKYRCRKGQEMCGAYLFLPDGRGHNVDCDGPIIRVSEGHLLSQVIVHCNYLVHVVNVYNTSGADDYGIEIQNLVDIRDEINFELAMRLSTNIKNQDVFYTDLNGYQIIKRKYYDKLPLQANFYPMASSMYIEDDNIRMTLVSAQPLGASSLEGGQIEVMQDRTSDQDDNLGLGQGIKDNKPTLHIFRLLLEKRTENCQKMSENHFGGFLSVASHMALNDILYPSILLVDSGNFNQEDLEPRYSLPSVDRLDYVNLHLVSLTTLPDVPAAGLVLHNIELDKCFPTDYKFNINNDGLVNASYFVKSDFKDKLYQSSLTFTQIGKELNKQILYSLCPMDLDAFYFPVRSN